MTCALTAVGQPAGLGCQLHVNGCKFTLTTRAMLHNACSLSCCAIQQ